MSETSGEFGIAVGIAGLGSLATFVYRDQLGRMPPRTRPTPTTAALDSLAGAVRAATTLPGAAGHELVDGRAGRLHDEPRRRRRRRRRPLRRCCAVIALRVLRVSPLRGSGRLASDRLA